MARRGEGHGGHDYDRRSEGQGRDRRRRRRDVRDDLRPDGTARLVAQANCFHPEARQIRTWLDAEGRPTCKIMGLADYARDTTPFFAEHDFFEVEIARRIDLFGNIAHVWSAYEARTARDDAEPERRGINSIQLFKDPARGWRIIAMIWDNERDGVTLPEFG